MQIHQTAFAGDTANKLKTQFDALKMKHPHLGKRGILALIRHNSNIRCEANRLGFGMSENEVER